MRTLFLCPRSLWPLDTGAKQRDYHLARALADAVDTTLLAFAETEAGVLPQAQQAGFAEVISVPRPAAFTMANLARGFVGTSPVSILNFSSPAMHDALRSVLARQRFDTVHVAGVFLASYLPTIRRHAAGARILCDWHNIESELMRRYAANAQSTARRVYALRTAYNLERAERRMLAAAEGLFVTSAREKAVVSGWNTGCAVHVVENGVDMRRFAGAGQHRDETPRQRRSLLFVGSLDYHANIDAVVSFAQAAWPAIKRAVPKLCFTIVGRNPSPAVCALAQVDGVVVAGGVDDVAPYYREAVAAIVPLRVGGGTRLKILEAMGFAVPVVSTALGIEGLAAEADRHYLRADDPDAMAAAVRRLAGEPELARRLTAEASSLIRERYDWARIGADLVEHHRRHAGAPGDGHGDARLQGAGMHATRAINCE